MVWDEIGLTSAQRQGDTWSVVFGAVRAELGERRTATLKKLRDNLTDDSGISEVPEETLLKSMTKIIFPKADENDLEAEMKTRILVCGYRMNDRGPGLRMHKTAATLT